MLTETYATSLTNCDFHKFVTHVSLCHDKFDVLIFCFADRQLTEQEQTDLLNHADLSMCNTATLSEALKQDALPAKLLAEAAIKVAEEEKVSSST